jgi:hypothetical protein
MTKCHVADRNKRTLHLTEMGSLSCILLLERPISHRVSDMPRGGHNINLHPTLELHQWVLLCVFRYTQQYVVDGLLTKESNNHSSLQ